MFNSVIFFCVLFLPILAHAQIGPLHNLTLEVAPSFGGNENDVNVKQVKVAVTADGLTVTWFSLAKELYSENPYPHYKIKSKKGVIQFDSLLAKGGFFLPALWSDGYMRLDSVLPLWVDPIYLGLKNREKRAFNLGILNFNRNLVKATPDLIFEKLSYFQNLYDQFVERGAVRSDVNLNKSDQRELKKFSNDFFEIQSVARTEVSIIVNQVQKTVKARILGNDYFQLVVLDNSDNPLVLAVKFFPNEAPRIFKSLFSFFKKNLEFKITQVGT
jgi:hypothetical protein